MREAVQKWIFRVHSLELPMSENSSDAIFFYLEGDHKQRGIQIIEETLSGDNQRAINMDEMSARKMATVCWGERDHSRRGAWMSE